MNFEEIKSKWSWKPIPDCPGRFVCREGNKMISPAEIVGEAIHLQDFEVKKAVDTVVVGRIDGGGLISYRKADGTYLHTLNTVEGFARKLAQLDIKLQ